MIARANKPRRSSIRFLTPRPHFEAVGFFGANQREFTLYVHRVPRLRHHSGLYHVHPLRRPARPRVGLAAVLTKKPPLAGESGPSPLVYAQRREVPLRSLAGRCNRRSRTSSSRPSRCMRFSTTRTRRTGSVRPSSSGVLRSGNTSRGGVWRGGEAAKGCGSEYISGAGVPAQKTLKKLVNEILLSQMAMPSYVVHILVMQRMR